MTKKRVIQVLGILCLIYVIILSSRGVGYDFTIESYWEKGGKIVFEEYVSADYPGTTYDYDYTNDGVYSYNGSSPSGDLIYNYTIKSPAQEFLLSEGNSPIGLRFLIYVDYELEKGDAVIYDFNVSNGSVDFLVLNENQFTSWFGGNTSGQAQSIEFLHTEIPVNGTINITTADNYYFVWWNNPDYNSGNVILQYQLNAKIAERSSIGAVVVNPSTLEEIEGEKFTTLGMDTSDWKIDDKVLFEIDEREVYLTIIRDEEVIITYNNETTEIPCWVLEITDYERTEIEDDTYTIKADYYIWKSKYSGITLKTTSDREYYNSDSTLFFSSYRKYTVISANDVLLMPKQSSTPLSFIAAVMSLFVIKRYRRNRK